MPRTLGPTDGTLVSVVTEVPCPFHTKGSFSVNENIINNMCLKGYIVRRTVS